MKIVKTKLCFFWYKITKLCFIPIN